MTNVVSILERLGENANLRYLDPVALEQALVEEGIGELVRGAILASDEKGLARLLGVSPTVVCGLFPTKDPDKDDDKDDEPDEDDDKDDKPKAWSLPNIACGP